MDILSGSDSLENARELYCQLIQLCRSGGFILRKWTSNNLQVFENVKSEFRNIDEYLRI